MMQQQHSEVPSPQIYSNENTVTRNQITFGMRQETKQKKCTHSTLSTKSKKDKKRITKYQEFWLPKIATYQLSAISQLESG